jgi:hypothetical protein
MCSICTAAPTTSPSAAPTAVPTTTPTATPSNSALFGIGEKSAADNIGLAEEHIAIGAGAAAVGTTVLIVLIVIGIIAAIVVCFAVVSTAGGIYLYRRRMFNADDHAFEGSIVSGKSVAIGREVEAPSWALESGGTGINPLGNDKDLRRVHSFFSSLKKTFSTAAMRESPFVAENKKLTSVGNSAALDSSSEGWSMFNNPGKAETTQGTESAIEMKSLQRVMTGIDISSEDWGASNDPRIAETTQGTESAIETKSLRRVMTGI